jgi:hypothetical protein
MFSDASIIFSFKNLSDECRGFHRIECPCLTSPTRVGYLGKTLNTIRSWRSMIKDVVAMEEFHNRNVRKSNGI